MKGLILSFGLIILGISLYAQKPQILGREINNPSHSSVYPAVSGDGRVMVYMTDYSDDGSFIMSLTRYRGGKWQRPEDISVMGSSKVNNWGGYCLSYDGTQMYFSSRRSNGVGFYDVWYVEYSNGEWSLPKNVGKPINSGGQEGNPSISPDGQRIYFMRCDAMTNSDVSGCKLFYSDRGARGWGNPIEMPEHINKGNTTSPRILPDNRTLVFASDRPGGKGGIDLWMTRRTGSHWSEPENIEPVNTAENDYFLTATLRSIAFVTMAGENGNKAIGEIRLPPEYRLSNVVFTQGTIKDEEGNNLNAEVQAYNTETKEYEYRRRLSKADDNFIMILPEGAIYNVGYNELRLDKMYQSEVIDAKDMVASRREYPNVVLKEIEEGMTLRLNGVDFEPTTVDLLPTSELEIGRLVRILERHPEINIEVGVYQRTYAEDVALTQEDLTETRMDSTIVYEEPIRIDTLNNTRLDELIKQINQELLATIQDTAVANVYMARMGSVVPVKVHRVNTVFHNDRSEKQAAVVKARLVEDGLAEERITIVGYRDAEPPVDFPAKQDRLVVVKLLNGMN